MSSNINVKCNSLWISQFVFAIVTLLIFFFTITFMFCLCSKIALCFVVSEFSATFRIVLSIQKLKEYSPKFS